MAYSQYYIIKRNAEYCREDFLHTLADAYAVKGNQSKEKIYRDLLQHERQRRTAKRIKYLRGKFLTGSTTMVQVRNPDSSWREVSDKTEMEAAIMDSTKWKYTADFHTPFMQPPLVGSFGYMGVGRAADEVLEGTFSVPEGVDEFTTQLI